MGSRLGTRVGAAAAAVWHRALETEDCPKLPRRDGLRDDAAPVEDLAMRLRLLVACGHFFEDVFRCDNSPLPEVSLLER